MQLKILELVLLYLAACKAKCLVCLCRETFRPCFAHHYADLQVSQARAAGDLSRCVVDCKWSNVCSAVFGVGGGSREYDRPRAFAWRQGGQGRLFELGSGCCSLDLVVLERYRWFEMR